MELTREHFRAMIYYDFKSGLKQKESIERLRAAFGEEAPSSATVYNWFAEFNRGRISLEDEAREGRPCTAVTEENINAVRELIEADRHVTYVEISSTLGIGMSQVQKILHEHLSVRKLCSRWIPHMLTDDQKKKRVEWCREKLRQFNQGTSNAVYNIVTGDETWIYSYEPETKCQSRVWVFQDENKPTKVIRSRSVSKKMIASFFQISGHVATMVLEDRRTVNADWYTTVSLAEVIQECRRNNPNRRIILHHDNASSHTAKQTTEFLTEANVELMHHPPYSPDLAPCDFFLFPNAKQKLRGQRFPNPEAAVAAYREVVSEISTSEWHLCFEKWFKRMKKCIEFKGDYFEKQ